MNISNLLKNNRKALNIVLCILLLISNFTIVVNAEDTAVEETEVATENTQTDNEALPDEEITEEVFLESDETSSEEETENGVTGGAVTSDEQVPTQTEQQEVVEQDDVVTLVENTIVYSEDDYEITISGILPEGARVEAYEIKQENTEYDNLVDGATKSVLIDNDETDCDELAYSRFFDITILDENNNVFEPNEPLKVEIDLKDVDINSEDVTFSAVHFEDENNAQVVEVEVNEDSNVVTIEADSFSVYGIVYYYTVDFYYNNNEYHMNGGSKMLLSELFERLEIDKDISNIESVSFTNDELVTFDKENNDYRITSLKPFTTSEELSIKFVDGTEIIIKVEDAVYKWWLAGGDVYAELNDTTGKLIIRPKDSLGGASGHASISRNMEKISDWPWNPYRSQIKEVEFQGTIDFSAPRNCNFMFANCSNLTKVTGLENFDTTYALALARMFSRCTSLENIDISSFKNAGTITNMQNMFNDCTKLKTITMPSQDFKVGNNALLTQMFQNCSSLQELNFNKMDVHLAKTMTSMFDGCTSLKTLNVSGFGQLNNIENMDGFVNGCTSLETLNMDNLDNSVIGSYNTRHSINDDDSQITGAQDYGRMLNIETCTSLRTLSAKNSKVWMVYNDKGLPGKEYYKAAEEGDIYYFTDKVMTFDSDYTSQQVLIDSNRDYIDLIIDRDGSTNVHTMNPNPGNLPDAEHNINIKYGDDLNPHGPGFLAPGVYTLEDESRSNPEHAPMEDTYYRIAYVGNKPYTVEWPEGGIDGLVKVEDNSRNYVTINTTKGIWPITGSKEIDCGSGIKITYKDVAIDCNGKLHDVVVTIKKIKFKDLDKVPHLSDTLGGVSYRNRTHDANKFNNKVLDDDQEYYRPVLQAQQDGIVLLNYIRAGDSADPSNPGSGTQMLTGGSGTDIEFTIEIDEANDNTSFVFLAEDVDVEYSQEWTYNSNGDACYDNLPIEKVTYGQGGEGFVLGEGVKAGTVQFAEHTGLYKSDNMILATGGDPNTPWSEFTVTADAQGSTFTWTSGIGCTSYILRNTKEQDVGIIELQPQVKKEVKNGSLIADKFEFKLEKVSTDPDGVPEPSEGTTAPTAVPQTKKNDAAGNVVFDKLVFKTKGENAKISGSDKFNYFPGTNITPENTQGKGTHNSFTYTYEVTEVIGTSETPSDVYKFDDNVHTIKIVISTPENDNEMKQGIKAQIYADDALVNTYWHSKEYYSVATGTLIDKWYDESGNEIDNPNPINLSNIVFTNIKVKPIEVKIPVEKILEGRPWKDTDEFGAALTIVSENPDTPMPSTAKKEGDLRWAEVDITSSDTPIKDDSDKVIGYKDLFDAIEFKYPDVGKTYSYHVRELTPTEDKLPSIPGVTYDETSKYTVSVKIGLDETDPDEPKLTYTISKKDKDNIDITADPRFINTYDANQTIYKMEAVKVYHDVNNNTVVKLDGGEFSFALKPIGDYASIAPMPKATIGEGVNRVFTTTNEDDGDIEFENTSDSEDGLVFNYQNLLNAGISEEDLHSENGVDFEYEMWELIPGKDGRALTEEETLINNNDGTWSVFNKNTNEEIVYDGIHHTRTITVKVRTVVDDNDTPDDPSDDRQYDELYIVGHKDDHKADFYIVKDGNEKDAGSIPGYDASKRHFKVGGDDLGAPIFLNYYKKLSYGSLKVNVVWDDDNNKAEKRTKTTLTLYKSIDGGEPVEVTEDIFKEKIESKVLESIEDGQYVQWGNLPLSEDGKPVKYLVKEKDIESGYYIATPEGTELKEDEITSIDVKNLYNDSKPIEKTVTRKIHYLNNKGATVFDDVVESVTFVASPKVKVDTDGNPILDENGKLQIEWYDEKDQLLGTDTGDGSKIDWGKSTVKKKLAKVTSKDKYRYEFDTDEVEEIEVSPTDKDIEVDVIYTPDDYQVHFKPNGGTGEMDDQVMTWDELERLSPNKFTRDGYVFKGWNSKADGTGIQFNDLQAVINLLNEDQNDITLYAQWEEASQPIPTPPTPYIPPKTGI